MFTVGSQLSLMLQFGQRVTKHVPSPALLVAMVVMLVALSGCEPAPKVLFGSWQPTHPATPDIAALEREMFERLNRDRRSQGLGPLSYDARLADVARAHAADMRDHGFFAHESPTTGLLEDRMDRAGYLALEMRENLAQAENVQRAEDNLLDSPGHRKNIMAPSITHVGIGVVRGGGGDPRVLTITQVFARPVALDTPEQAAQKVVARMSEARRSKGLPPLEVHPLLDDLAAAHIGEVPDGVPEGAVSDIGGEVSSELNAAKGHGLASILIAAQGFFAGEEFEVPGAALDGRTARYGLATAPAKDLRGRPRVKVLLLLGQVGP